MVSIICKEVAGGLGFEPRQSESESEGLPLADPPIMSRDWWVFSGGAAIAQVCFGASGSELLDQAGKAGLRRSGTRRWLAWNGLAGKGRNPDSWRWCYLAEG